MLSKFVPISEPVFAASTGRLAASKCSWLYSKSPWLTGLCVHDLLGVGLWDLLVPSAFQDVLTM